MAVIEECRPWTVHPAGPVAALELILPDRTYVLPWSQFVYAEGTTRQVRAAFTTHEITVEGAGLETLLADFAAEQISILRLPAAGEASNAAGPNITAIEVSEVEDDELEFGLST